jgi:hypothetical protein
MATFLKKLQQFFAALPAHSLCELLREESDPYNCEPLFEFGSKLLGCFTTWHTTFCTVANLLDVQAQQILHEKQNNHSELLYWVSSRAIQKEFRANSKNMDT